MKTMSMFWLPNGLRNPLFPCSKEFIETDFKSQDKKVLIAEDDPVNQALLKTT